MRRIVELGNAQLAENGPAGLSVREIARGLDMVSSAIYRYVRSRDDLLTLLIVDAYEDLADAVDADLADAGRSPKNRFLALGRAMATWALAHPERWSLLYGTPVTGYDAPAEETTAPGTRVMARILEIAADAERDTPRSADAGRAAGPELDAGVAALAEEWLEDVPVAADAPTVIRAVTAWSALVGAIGAPVFGQLGGPARALGARILEAQLPLIADLVAPV